MCVCEREVPSLSLTLSERVSAPTPSTESSGKRENMRKGKEKDRRVRRKLEVERREEARRGKCGQVALKIQLKKLMAASGH